MYSQEPMMVNAAAGDDATDAAVAAPAQVASCLLTFTSKSQYIKDHPQPPIKTVHVA